MPVSIQPEPPMRMQELDDLIAACRSLWRIENTVDDWDDMYFSVESVAHDNLRCELLDQIKKLATQARNHGALSGEDWGLLDSLLKCIDEDDEGTALFQLWPEAEPTLLSMRRRLRNQT